MTATEDEEAAAINALSLILHEWDMPGSPHQHDHECATKFYAEARALVGVLKRRRGWRPEALAIADPADRALVAKALRSRTWTPANEDERRRLRECIARLER